MVTNVAMVRVKTRMRRWGLSTFRSRLVMTLAQIRTKAVAPAIVSAGFMPPVTASVGHSPSRLR